MLWPTYQNEHVYLHTHPRDKTHLFKLKDNVDIRTRKIVLLWEQRSFEQKKKMTSKSQED